MRASDTKYRCLHFCTWESFGVSLGTLLSIWRRQLLKLFLYGDLKLELESFGFHGAMVELNLVDFSE